MTKKATSVQLVEETSCSIETGGSSTPFNPKQPDGQWSLSHQNRWPLRLFAPPLRPRELEASTRQIDFSPFEWNQPRKKRTNPTARNLTPTPGFAPGGLAQSCKGGLVAARGCGRLSLLRSDFLVGPNPSSQGCTNGDQKWLFIFT